MGGHDFEVTIIHFATRTFQTLKPSSISVFLSPTDVIYDPLKTFLVCVRVHVSIERGEKEEEEGRDTPPSHIFSWLAVFVYKNQAFRRARECLKFTVLWSRLMEIFTVKKPC